MFKKKYLAVAGLMVLAVAAVGCGKKKETDTVVQVTPTPAEAVAVTPTQELVNMEAVTEKNVMGEKTSTASKLTLLNRTGSDVAAIYIRQTPSGDSDEDEWGDDLVNGMFTLKNGDTAVYYYEKPKTSSGTYDIRITYTDEDKNECFFRKLPLMAIQQITLRMDGTGEDSIPYATYTTATSKKETSTLKEVKKRLGLDDSDNDDSDSSNSSSSSSNSSSSSDSAPAPTSAPVQSQEPDIEPDATDSTIQTAESYIGMTVEDLEGAVGDSQYSEYDDDDATGMTGYYYYPNFTVSTTVDEDGNEIVTGVW